MAVVTTPASSTPGTTRTPASADVSGAGNSNVTDSGTTQTTTPQGAGFSLNPITWLNNLLGLFGSPDFKDWLERFGLIVFGGALVLVGIIILFMGSPGMKLIPIVQEQQRIGLAGRRAGLAEQRESRLAQRPATAARPQPKGP